MNETPIFIDTGSGPARGKAREKGGLEHKRSFILHYDEMCVIMELDDAAAGTLLKCMIAHAVQRTGMTERRDLPLSDAQLQGMIDKMRRTDKVLDVLFRQFIIYFREDTLRYSRRVNACRENGRKGGAPVGNDNAAMERQADIDGNDGTDGFGFFGLPQDDSTKNNQKQPKQATIAKGIAEVRAKGLAEETAEEIMEAPDGAFGGAETTERNFHRVDSRRIMREFNEVFAGILPEVKTMTEARRRAIQARIREFGPESVRLVMEKVRDSAFLTGKGGRGWRASFDWIFKPGNFAKIAEGNYDYERTAAMCMPRFESATERERRLNERLKEEIFNKAMRHIHGAPVPETAERGNAI